MIHQDHHPKQNPQENPFVSRSEFLKKGPSTKDSHIQRMERRQIPTKHICKEMASLCFFPIMNATYGRVENIV